MNQLCNITNYVFVLNYCCINLRDVAQPGSALHWGCSGRRFKSGHPDQYNYKKHIIIIKKVFFVCNPIILSYNQPIYLYI